MGTAYVRFVSFKCHGLVVMDTQFFAELMEAVERACHRAGLTMMITNIHKERDPDYQARIRNICEEDCAGILLLATEMHPEDLALFRHARAPLVVVDSLFENEPYNTVVMNNQEAGFLAAKRLLDAGHRRIAHITSSVPFNNMMFRRLGYQQAMALAGISTAESDIWPVTPTLDGSYRDMLALLDGADKPVPTAFFAANDIIAIGCARALKEKGYALPDDISLIGMDDLDICEVIHPALSTVRVLREEIAKAAVRRLVELMEEREHPHVQKIQVGVVLVDRNSVTGPPGR